MPRLPRVACLSLAVALFTHSLSSLLAAQATTVTLRGFVHDEEGDTPLGAQVEVRERETGVLRIASVGEDGRYHVLGLSPGSYDVTVRAIGYRQQRREALQLILGQNSNANFVLTSGAVELEPLVVVADRRFEVDRSDVSTAVLQEEIARLPFNSRNVLNVAGVAPGIRTFAVEAGRTVPASGSMPVAEPRFSNLYVDGVEWKGMYVGQIVGNPQTGSMIPQEAVREFRVYLNTYDAEYTRGASHIVSAVTHRGGNRLEGSVFGFGQNQSLVARGTFQTEKPDYSRYQIGGNARGPLIRDRLFFALSYEGQITDDFISIVPGRPPESPGIWDRYAGTFKAPDRNHTGLLRLTAPLGSHTLDVIGATRRTASEGGFGTQLDTRLLTYEAGVTRSTRINSLQLRDAYSGRAVVNELSIHLLDLRNEQSLLFPGTTFQYPGLQIRRANIPFLNEERHIRAINKTSYTLNGAGGQHVFKGGVELSRVRLRVYRPSNKDGFFRFNNATDTLPGLGQIALGLNDPTSTSEGQATVRGWLLGAYLQDQWQPVPSLTVTAGLRYDADINTLNQALRTPWAEDATLRDSLGEDYLNTSDRENDLNNIAPRLSIRWDVFGTNRTFLRGGYGIMYDRVPLYGTITEAISIGWRTYTFLNPGTTDPEELRRRVLAGSGGSAQNLTLLKDRLEAPANHQWSAGVGQQVTSRFALNLDYVHQRVKNGYVSVKTNLRDPITGTRPITSSYGDITIWDDFGDARFDALLASLTYDRPPTRLNLAYTLGWAKSEFGEFTTSDYPDSADYSMQRSEGDERHRFVLSGLTTLPFGLELSGIAIVASPRPVLATVGADLDQNGSPNDDWPDGIRTLRRTGWNHWYRTIDLRLGKSFLMPHGSLMVTAEVFNVLNWSNHSEYQATQNLLAYGDPVGDYARRQAQVGLRYQF